jgi:outer membrane protein assembly factor BamD
MSNQGVLGALLGFNLLLGAACSVDSPRHHYSLAERFWGDKNYAAAVAEFERVVAKDSSSELAQQALFRAATTQALFLGQYSEAVQKLRTFIQKSSDIQLIWSAQTQIGDLLYSSLENYEQSILHYLSLLKTYPHSDEAPSFYFRIAKSHFFLFQFSEALQTYQRMILKYPKTIWSEKASFEVGMTYYTRGQRQVGAKEGDASDFKKAISAYEHLIQDYPKSELISEARFGIASCLEELDQLEEAFRIYSELKKTYPSPNVIEIKLIRIRERMAHRRRKR